MGRACRTHARHKSIPRRCSVQYYGHLARDGREHAIKLLDALNAPEFDPWTLVDVRWTSRQPVSATPENESDE
jgi:hypothetical protein